MNVSEGIADDGAIRQLETLFHSADPSRSGVLSFSEFAYLILKSGGTQEQADALIDQFSAPARSQRVVCYEALLEQLRDSLMPSREGSADDAGTSPLPVPPQSATDISTTVRPVRHDAVGASHYRAGQEERQNRASLSASSPTLRSFTHAGSRASSTVSRDSVVTAHGGRSSREQQQLQHYPYPTRPQYSQQPVASSSSQEQEQHQHQPSPVSVLQPSSRFVASVLRAASAGAARSRSRSGTPRHHTDPEASSGLKTDLRLSDQHPDEGFRSTSAPYPLGREAAASDVKSALLRNTSPAAARAGTDAEQSLVSESRSRESSIARMTRAAMSAKPHLSINAGSGHLRKPVHEEQFHQANGSVLSSSSYQGPHSMSAGTSGRQQVPRTQPHDSVLSTTTTTTTTTASAFSKPSLLSLREVFQQHVLPAAASRDTVLLSELEALLATRGVEVHPLELEAVADSLELPSASPSIDPTPPMSRVMGDLSNVGSSAGHSTTTITGGADREMGLVDFCVLVSRLRPGLIRLMRSPATWTTPHQEETTTATSARTTVDGTRRRQSSRGLASRGSSDDSFTTPAARGSQHRHNAYVTSHPSSRPSARENDEDAGNEDDVRSEGEASITDVTVSPMTPPTANATPQSHRRPSASSSSAAAVSGHPAAARRHASQLVDTRRPLSLRQHTLYDGAATTTTAAAAPASFSRYVPQQEEEGEDDDDVPPTARQLSSDRHFSVAAAALSDNSPEGLPSELGEEPQSRYAQPTASSQMRERRSTRRTAASRTHASQRRTKQPVWHDDLEPATSPLTTSGYSSRSSRSPSSLSPPHARQPRRVSVSIRSPGVHRPAQRTRETSVGSPSVSSTSTSPYHQPQQQPQPPKHRADVKTKKTSGCQQAPSLPPHVLEALQRAASAILMKCTQLDVRHSGSIPARAWSQVLRSSCPTLRPHDCGAVERWIEELRQRDSTVTAAAGSDVYSAVVEAMLTQGEDLMYKWTPSSATEVSPSSSAYAQTPLVGTSHRRVHSPAITPSSEASPSPSRSPLRPPPPLSASSHAIRETDEQLRAALLAACGGDTGALQAFWYAFDAPRRGYLHEHVWRASLEELFRRTMAREVPPWVVERCVALSRRPLLDVEAETRGRGTAVKAPRTAAERAARGRARRVPSAQRRMLCDYQYLLHELGLATH